MLCAVKPIGGVPTLTVNGKPVAANAYMTYYTDAAHYADFAAAGFRLFSVPLMFAGQTFSETSTLPALYPGIFDGDTPDFTTVDGQIRQIHAACPDALILPRVNVSVSAAWEDAHPDEMLDRGLRSRKRACFSSPLWLEEAERMLRLFLRHVQESDYAEHVIGCHLAGGNTEEWFPFDEQGGHGKRSREGFARWCAENGQPATEEMYYRYLSENTAAVICRLARVAKEETDGRMAVGAFYGYTFECPMRKRNHHALSRVLECPDIDFLSSPVSYDRLREPGIDEAYMLPVDSLELHGKLYLAEQDARTHLTKRPRVTSGFTSPIWAAKDKQDALGNMDMMAARALTHGAGFWWFDMWGGWYADPDYMRLVGEWRQRFADGLTRDRRSSAEVAVLADETVLCRFADADTPAVMSDFRRELGLIGAPYAAYLASDYEPIREQYRAFILLAPCVGALGERVIADCEKRGVPLMLLTPDRLATAADYRDFCETAGVTLYTDRPSVVYASGDYLYFYTPEPGAYTLRFPEGKTAVPVTPDAPTAFPADLPAHSGYLYQLT